jgi:hypothetical protein
MSKCSSTEWLLQQDSNKATIVQVDSFSLILAINVAEMNQRSGGSVGKKLIYLRVRELIGQYLLFSGLSA